MIAAGALVAAVGVMAAARLEVLKRRDEQADKLASALRVPVCAAAEVQIEKVGVDPVDPSVLERALMIHESTACTP